MRHKQPTCVLALAKDLLAAMIREEVCSMHGSGLSLLLGRGGGPPNPLLEGAVDHWEPTGRETSQWQ